MPTEIERIVDLMFDELRDRLLERRITLEVTEAARRFIAQQGFDPVYGARPLRRFIAREVETRIGRALLADEVQDESVLTVELRGRRARDPPHRRRAARGGMSTAVMTTVVQLPDTAARSNRVPAVADGIPRCGNCHRPLPWIADADDDSLQRRRRAGRAARAGRPLGDRGAVRAGWSAPRWSRWPPSWPAG